jgi:hypothetical protein
VRAHARGRARTWLGCTAGAPPTVCHLDHVVPTESGSHPEGREPQHLLSRQWSAAVSIESTDVIVLFLDFRPFRRSGTESSSDSPLEGDGFELPVRGRGKFRLSPLFLAPGCVDEPARSERGTAVPRVCPASCRNGRRSSRTTRGLFRESAEVSPHFIALACDLNLPDHRRRGYVPGLDIIMHALIAGPPGASNAGPSGRSAQWLTSSASGRPRERS